MTINSSNAFIIIISAFILNANCCCVKRAIYTEALNSEPEL